MVPATASGHMEALATIGIPKESITFVNNSNIFIAWGLPKSQLNGLLAKLSNASYGLFLFITETLQYYSYSYSYSYHLDSFAFEPLVFYHYLVILREMYLQIKRSRRT